MMKPRTESVRNALATRRSGAGRIVAALCLIACAQIVPAPARAAGPQFTVTPVSDEKELGREPVIADAKLLSWIAADSSGENARIVALLDGKLQEVASPDRATAATRPQAFSNQLAWVAAFSNLLAEVGKRFAEVPDRDVGAEELRALYSATEDGQNRPILMPVPATNVQYYQRLATNAEGVVYITNVAETVTNSNEVRRLPSGPNELVFWTTTSTAKRITFDNRNDFSPSLWDGQMAWQKARGWPFGWEIFFWKDGVQKQLTTNFYYEMAPKVQGDQVVWYGWDGHDFEIYLYDLKAEKVMQITSNRFDDVAPVVWNGQIAWEGYEAAEADIWLYRDGKDTNGQPVKVISKISNNPEDDINPRIWNGRVVWQGFDGDDFEIYQYDGVQTRKITANDYDDTNPDIRDDLVTWMGYKDNWDAEIFAWDGSNDPVQVTDNEQEDREPRTAGGRIAWQQDSGGKSRVFLATPK